MNSKRKPDKNKTKKTKDKSRLSQYLKAFKKLFIYSIVLIITLLLLPYALVILYKWENINPISRLMLSETLTFGSYERYWVDFDDINPVVVQAVIMSEDGKYCTHNGVDWDALKVVVQEALNGGASRGASTISMQTMKNLYLTPERSNIRKALEVPLALFSDIVWSKQRTMEIYLNIAEWGHHIYGIEAAAQFYFGKTAKTLNRRQAALLVAALPNPKLRNPAQPSHGLQKRAKRIEAASKASGAYIKCIYD